MSNNQSPSVVTPLARPCAAEPCAVYAARAERIGHRVAVRVETFESIGLL